MPPYPSNSVLPTGAFYIQEYFAPHAKSAAGAVGLPPERVYAGVSEEFNDQRTSGFGLNAAVDYVASSRSHEQIKANYEYFNLPENAARLARSGVLDKLVNPALTDVGPGNIKVHTAISTLEWYNQKYPSSDPLNLKQYNSDYKKLTTDMSSFERPQATANMAAALALRAQDFYETYAPEAWAAATNAEKAALTSTYYNRGERVLLNEKSVVEQQGKEWSPKIELGGEEYIQ